MKVTPRQAPWPSASTLVILELAQVHLLAPRGQWHGGVVQLVAALGQFQVEVKPGLAGGHALAQVVKQEVGALGLGLVVAQALHTADGLEEPLAPGGRTLGVDKAKAMHAPVVQAGKAGRHGLRRQVFAL